MHTILAVVYQFLNISSTHQDLGHDYFDTQAAGQHQRRLIRRLETLGLRVILEPSHQAAQKASAKRIS